MCPRVDPAGFSGCLASELSQNLMQDDEAGAIK
jgi:hypothetical protein